MNRLPADNSNEMSFLILFLRQSVVCLIWSALLSLKKCVITASTIFVHRPRREFIEYMIRLYAGEQGIFTRQLNLCTKLHNTEPDICGT